MRRVRQRTLPLLLTLIPLLPACFSTTRPEAEDPSRGGGGAATRVTGLVQRHPATGAVIPVGSGWLVDVHWLRRNPSVPGRFDLVDRDMVKTTGVGVYEATTREPDVAMVEVRTVACEVSPDDPDCCRWEDPVLRFLAPGEQVTLHLVLRCRQ